MDKITRKTCSLLCIIAILTGLTSCGPDIPDMSTKPSESPSEATNKTTTAAPKADIAGSHILMTFDNNFSVDATYSGPGGDMVDTLFCKSNEIDDESLIRVFFNGDTAEKKNTVSGICYVSGNRKIDILMDWQNPRITYSRDDFDRYENVFRGEPDSDFNSSAPLEFMSSSEAVDLVKKTLDSLGVQYVDKATVKSYNLANLEALGNSGKSMNQDNKEKSYANYIYTKDDEFYSIKLEPAVDYVPVSRFFSETDTGIKAYISSKGIEHLDIRTTFKKTESSKISTGNIVSVETALQTLHNFYLENKKDKKIDVVDVSFKYSAKINTDNTGFDLIPTWEIVSTFKTESDELITNISDINAYTGEFMPEGVENTLITYG